VRRPVVAFFFIQMSDPQLGLFASISKRDDPSSTLDGFEYETAHYEKAISAANRLKPAFVVITGDLVQDPHDQAQVDELQRISSMLHDNIPLRLAPGNCDVGTTPTPALLSLYRDRFGDDTYSFDHEAVHFVVLNSGICFDPSEVSDEWERLLDFLREDLAAAQGRDITRIVLFLHHPPFGTDALESDSSDAIPGAQRGPLLELLRSHNVETVFAGHWHKNASAFDGSMEVVISGPVGYPLGDDPSGIRIVSVYDDRIEHRYYGLDEVPSAIKL
jgi:3',5'-cyclic AMP phosphodiesterase CpdA